MPGAAPESFSGFCQVQFQAPQASQLQACSTAQAGFTMPRAAPGSIHGFCRVRCGAISLICRAALSSLVDHFIGGIGWRNSCRQVSMSAACAAALVPNSAKAVTAETHTLQNSTNANSKSVTAMSSQGCHKQAPPPTVWSGLATKIALPLRADADGLALKGSP